ncbi:dihydroorotate dehydrogenase electron transfer subunit [Candidatus Magnetaquicoccus inordinatus]|uniref:dihydroorotate dehydrogenase electron transfer subunit n=1 Tax=Candidatus Magnetaquicoccus inordinatus TaxID=2496818 RepID=UPI00102AD202|nr:dihydroorotate dehydrogenase electron transfer subunit [Candidatus Magnetaquicoccus inordinatus]
MSSIHYLSAQVLRNERHGADLGWMRLAVPGLGEVAPGQFVQLNCGEDLTLPRPFSVWASNPDEGTIDLFYRIVGVGSARLATWKIGEQHAVLGPLGRAFSLPPSGSRLILVAGGVGLAPLDFLARHLVGRGLETVLFWGIESAVPFALQREAAGSGLTEGLSLSHLHSVGVKNRLASLQDREGMYHGYVTDLAKEYYQRLTEDERASVRLYTCGPLPMMAALAGWAAESGLSGEASLEAHMACGFGVCVGCVAGVRGEGEKRFYRRVCVEGPVFALQEVDWQHMC